MCRSLTLTSVDWVLCSKHQLLNYWPSNRVTVDRNNGTDGDSRNRTESRAESGYKHKAVDGSTVEGNWGND